MNFLFNHFFTLFNQLCQQEQNLTFSNLILDLMIKKVNEPISDTKINELVLDKFKNWKFIYKESKNFIEDVITILLNSITKIHIHVNIMTTNLELCISYFKYKEINFYLIQLD